ncbi:MAG: hypothetical protein RLZZ478_173 [Actinomycetota bacterium]|jgi:hypothetical protein
MTSLEVESHIATSSKTSNKEVHESVKEEKEREGQTKREEDLRQVQSHSS